MKIIALLLFLNYIESIPNHNIIFDNHKNLIETIYAQFLTSLNIAHENAQRHRQLSCHVK
jgi:hypothetical protein